MNDFLDNEAGSFDWGPEPASGWRSKLRRKKRSPDPTTGSPSPSSAGRPAPKPPVALTPDPGQISTQHQTAQNDVNWPLRYAALVAVGAAMLVLGVAAAWPSFAPQAAASPPPSVVIAPTPSATPTPRPTATPRPTSTPTPTPTVTPIPLVLVHVSGRVEQPGVVEVPISARAYEAIEAAGGALDDADLDRVNLASPIVDGEQLHVPAIGDDIPEPAERIPPATPLLRPTPIPPPTPTPPPANALPNGDPAPPPTGG